MREIFHFFFFLLSLIFTQFFSSFRLHCIISWWIHKLRSVLIGSHHKQRSAERCDVTEKNTKSSHLFSRRHSPEVFPTQARRASWMEPPRRSSQFFFTTISHDGAEARRRVGASTNSTRRARSLNFFFTIFLSLRAAVLAHKTFFFSLSRSHWAYATGERMKVKLSQSRNF